MNPGKDELLSEVEKTVLKAIILGEKTITGISERTGYPELIVEKGLELLIQRGLIHNSLIPTDKAFKLALPPRKDYIFQGLSYHRNYRTLFIEIMLLITFLALIGVTLRYFNKM